MSWIIISLITVGMLYLFLPGGSYAHDMDEEFIEERRADNETEI